jgi:hypothetical protein
MRSFFPIRARRPVRFLTRAFFSRKSGECARLDTRTATCLSSSDRVPRARASSPFGGKRGRLEDLAPGRKRRPADFPGEGEELGCKERSFVQHFGHGFEIHGEPRFALPQSDHETRQPPFPQRDKDPRAHGRPGFELSGD